MKSPAMRTRTLLVVALVLALTLGAQTRKPNVLFIVADDLGWNDVSWNNRNIHSPAIEELAAGGVLLDQYYVQPTCTPSRVAFMTGKYPYRVGRQHMYIKPLMPAGLPTNVNIMPDYFKQAGYDTHSIGKWHLGFCHQNYTPTYRGFDTFYGFYLGSQDYYRHSSQYTQGYDFRFNEKILRGPEVDGKYSADLFVKRAKAIFKESKKKKKQGAEKPWFTYLSFQSVHEPMQVPHEYTRNICTYKDKPRHFYSAMVSAMDDAVDKVVRSLKSTGQYNNTIIVFTTDNGGAVNFGGNNFPLRGTKGTLFEGGTRGIAFVHSPLLQNKGYINRNMMHGVDWLPTLMSAIGDPGIATSATDGLDQWEGISMNKEPVRDEVVYNIKEKPFMAAIRVGDYKLLWAMRTNKTDWYQPNEDIINPAQCEETKNTRSRAGLLNFVRGSPGAPRGIDTMDILKLNKDEDVEYWDGDGGSEDDNDEDEEELEIVHREKRNARRKGRRGKGWRKSRNNQRPKDNKNKNTKRPKKTINKKNKGHKNKSKLIPNDRGVKIRPVVGVGYNMLFNLKDDPEEKHDLKAQNPEMVELLKEKLNIHFKELFPKFVPKESQDGHPSKWGGVWGPGWCTPYTI